MWYPYPAKEATQPAAAGCASALTSNPQVTKYFLVYRDRPGNLRAELKPFRAAKARGSQISLWMPSAPPAALWHIRPRTSPGGAGQGSPSALPSGVAGVPAAAPAAATRSAGGAVMPAKRARIDDDASTQATVLVLPAAVRRQELQTQALALHAHQSPGRPGAGEVQEPWLGSLAAVVKYLRSCVTHVARGSAGEVFRMVLGTIPGEHLRQMWCPRGGGGLAHLLVTPPLWLLAEDDGGMSPPQDPDEGLQESEALELIEVGRRRVVWCGVVRCGVVWCGVAWRGVVWCGVVWCGVVWRGVV